MKKMEADVNVCQVLKIPHLFYIHVKDKNTGYERLVVGPRTFTSEEYEEVVKPQTKMIVIPPEHYVVIVNPLVMLNGQAKLRMGEKEIMFHQPPFPLYPGQEQEGPVGPLIVVQENDALLLRAEINLIDRSKTKREAGVEWLFKGPAVYLPQVGITLIQKISAIFIKPNQALMVKAKEDFEYNGELKKVGQSWLVKTVGPYLPSVHEKAGKIIQAIVLDNKSALHVSALRTFIDEKGVTRKAGTQWLVTLKDCNVYFPGVDEKIEKRITLTVLKGNEYCVILDPYDEETGKYKLGSNRLVKGPTHFFLYPEERMNGVKIARLLKRNNGVWLTAKEEFRSEDGILRKPGSQWHISGPCLFYPPLETDTSFKDAIISIDYPFPCYIFHIHHFVILILLLLLFIYQVFLYLK